MPGTKIFENLDANESLFFERELEHVKSKTYDIRYPELSITRLIPISTEAGPGAETIKYEQYDQVGIMKIIANYADDLPRSDVFGKEFSVIVKSVAGAYGYSVQEIRNAMMAKKPLATRKAAAVRRAYEEIVNRIGWFADGTAKWGGMRGILYSNGTTKANATTGAWLGGVTTPDQIIADVNIALQNIRTLTKNVESADTVVLPSAHYTHIASTPRSSTSDKTILEWLQKVNPGVSFEWANELKDVNPVPSSGVASNTNCALIYKKSSDKLTYEIPSPFEQFAPQARNLEFVVPAHGRVAGIVIYYPLSVYIMQNL